MLDRAGFTVEDPPPEPDDEMITRLAKLDLMAYERQREGEAKRLGWRVGMLDRLVAAARPKDEAEAGKFLTLPDPEPWPETVQLPELLDETRDAIRRHVILSEHAATAVALWVAHTWAYERWQHTPRLAITSPSKRCGKSTLLELLRILCRRPLKADSISAASTFRTIELLQPLTLLLDEADSFLEKNEELRGVLNSGFERSGMVVRVVEVHDQHQPMRFATFCPVALAAIGKLPGTLDDRAVPIRMERRAAGEVVQRLRDDGGRRRLEELARRLCRWRADTGATLGTDPVIPLAMNDREGDISVPLLAIAEAAGQGWAERGRAALLGVFRLRAEAGEDAEQSVLLLGDIRAVMLGTSAERMTSADLCRFLGEIEDRPWPEWRQGKPITPTQLAAVLRPFGIRSGDLRQPNGRVAKGYHQKAFAEAWERYLDRDPLRYRSDGGLDPLHRYKSENSSTYRPNGAATPEACSGSKNGENRSQNLQCSGVADPEAPPWPEWDVAGCEEPEV